MKKMKWIVTALMMASLLSGCSVASSVAQTAVAAPNTASSSVSNDKNAKLEWAFTQEDQHPEQLLISVINSAKSTLDIAIYSLTHPDIVQAIKEAKKRGVIVRIVSDGQQSGGKSQKVALHILLGAGIPIKIDDHSGLMHEKVTIADNKVVTTGSYNYSKAASTTNDEIIIVIRDPAVAKSFETNFNHMWNNEKGFKIFQEEVAK
jgi:phosphatidylserine/phosphatidylglycerophosphate/cardiolipin synthase-like enzyme